MKKNINLLFFLVIFGFVMVSCVKDTNFDEADDIALTPVFDVDLVYFDQDALDFFDPATMNESVTVTDTTEVRFINTSDIGENIKRVEFFFKFTNSIPRSFDANFDFLNANNVSSYQIQTTVTEGTTQAPIITERIENVEGDDIADLTRATKVVVSVTIDSSDENLAGTLNLQSKATYYLEL